MMDMKDVKEAVRTEIQRLTRVLSILDSGEGRSAPKKKHVMSKEARKKIGDAQRARWAKQKRAA
jgi:hypothetical protein